MSDSQHAVLAPAWRSRSVRAVAVVAIGASLVPAARSAWTLLTGQLSLDAGAPFLLFARLALAQIIVPALTAATLAACAVMAHRRTRALASVFAVILFELMFRLIMGGMSGSIPFELTLLIPVLLYLLVSPRPDVWTTAALAIVPITIDLSTGFYA